MKKLLVFLLPLLLSLPLLAQNKANPRVKIRACSTCPVRYEAVVTVPAGTYPNTTAGRLAFEAAVRAGTYKLTLDNGVIIAAGVRPPLTMPTGNVVTPPVTSTTVTPPTTITALVCSALSEQCTGNSSETKTFAIDSPGPATVSLRLSYKATEGSGTATVKVNNGSAQTVNCSATSTYATVTTTSVALVQGVNTIVIASAGGYLCFNRVCATVTTSGGNVVTPPVTTTTTPPSSTTAYISFQRGLIIGNSFTSAGAITATNWNLNNGMAASSLAQDYAHIIEAALKTTNPNFSILPSGNGSRFETDYNNTDPDNILNIKNSILTELGEKFGSQPVDLVIVSLSENVNFSTFDGGKFSTKLDELLSGIGSKIATGATFLFRDDVWTGHANAGAALKAYALSKGYKFADMTSVREPSGGGWPYYATQYDNAGVVHHPNDAGHAAIAALFLNQLKTTTTTSNTGTGGSGNPTTQPVQASAYAMYKGDSFAYSPLPESSTTDKFPAFETDKIKVTLALDNQYPASQTPGMGGAVFQIYNKSRPGKTLVYNALVWNGEDSGSPRTGNPNRIFTGQGLSECLYQPPIPFSTIGETGQGPHDAGLGYNPNEVGDDVGASGRLLKYGRDGNKFFTETRPMFYGQRQSPANDVLMRKWGEVSDRALILNYESTFSRASNAYQTVTRGQEAPCLYVNNMRTFKYYDGNSPYTNDAITTYVAAVSAYGNGLGGGQANKNGQRPGGQYVTEPWIGVFGDDGYGIALILKDNIRSYIGYFGDGGGNDGSPNKGGSYGYIAHAMNEMLDMNIRWRHRTEVVVGTVDEIRAYVYANSYRPDTKPSFKFNTAGRQGWSVNSGDGWATGNTGEQHTWDEVYTGNARNGWKVYFGTSSNASIQSPGVTWNTSQFNKIYVRMAYTGAETSWMFRFRRNRQKGDGPLDTNQSTNKYWDEENQRFPDGTADRAEQTVRFNVTGDSQYRIYEIDLSQNPEWRNIINEIKFVPHARNGVYSYPSGEFAIIDWVSSNPTGPTN